MTERIAFLVEYDLLPKTHFGARKQMSTTHALLYLREDVFRAWRGKKILSLVSFRIKGAYNSVTTAATDSQDDCLVGGKGVALLDPFKYLKPLD